MARRIAKFVGTLAAAIVLPVSALAVPITIVPIAGDDDGGWVDTYAMTDVAQFAPTDVGNTADDVDCVPSPISGDICFQGRYGAASDIDIVDNPTWWQYTQGNVYVTNKSWIEIILPEYTQAVSFWVGASFTGRAWVQATNEGGVSTDRYRFSVGAGNTSGYGAYVSEGCSYLTKIILEPADWGFGNLSINQGQCGAEVPEPAPIALLGIGLLALALARRRFTVVPLRHANT